MEYFKIISLKHFSFILPSLIFIASQSAIAQDNETLPVAEVIQFDPNSCRLIDGIDSEGETLEADILNIARRNCAASASFYLKEKDFKKLQGVSRASNISDAVGTNLKFPSTLADNLTNFIIVKQINLNQTNKKNVPASELLNTSETGGGCRNIHSENTIPACVLSLRAYGASSADFEDINGISNIDSIRNALNPSLKKIEPIKFSKNTADALGDIVEKRKAAFIKDRKDKTNARFNKRCLDIIKGVFDQCRLRASNTPSTVGTTQPASFSYTVNGDGDDSFAIASAFQGARSYKDVFLTLGADYQRNNQQTSQQDNLNIEAGFNFDIAPSLEAALRDFENDPLKTEQQAQDKFLKGFPSANIGVNIAYNRMGLFGDPTSDPCVADPDMPICGRQNLETLRLSGAILPYITQFGGDNFFNQGDGSSWHWQISPSGGVFYDVALNDDVVSASGEAVDGDVFGLNGRFAASLSPGFFQNRYEISLTGQIIQALSRDPRRITEDVTTNFEQTSRLFTASLQYALVEGSFVGQVSSNQVIPTIGFTYTNGSDSLRGRRSQNTFVASFNVEY